MNEGVFSLFEIRMCFSFQLSNLRFFAMITTRFEMIYETEYTGID